MGRFAFGIIMTPTLVLLLATFLVNLGVASGFQTGTPYNGVNTISTQSIEPGFFGNNASYPAFAYQTNLGCEQNATTRCNFQTISLLSPNAIPTCIITISLSCFINALSGLQGIQPQPFTTFSQNSSPVFAICLNFNGSSGLSGYPGSSIGDSWVLLSCDQIQPNGHKTLANETTMYNSQLNCTNGDVMNVIKNYAYWFCSFIPSHSIVDPITCCNSTYGIIFAVNGTIANDPAYSPSWINCIGTGPINSCDLSGSALVFHNNTTDPKNCPISYTKTNSSITPDCNGWITGTNNINAQSNSGAFGIALALGFAGSIILILIGLGLGIGAGGFTFNFSLVANTQGTRFAQALGFGLLFWVAALSEATPLFLLLGLGLAGTLIGTLTFVLIVGVMTQTLNVF